ncbi:type VII secretion protein EssB [Streptococcus oricebi]|uniref:Type VII secretion protein EssB n=1 Tax=Streptococcus oricebi TaxID=1547447 RepID=A0ABS5B725_9STRE|nr:type VII secretion protein EssB [Streptococcus oricebi]
MKQEEFTFAEQVFAYQKEEDKWSLSLKRSDVATQNMKELLLLNLHHPMFLKQELTFDEDTVSFSYELEKNGLSYDVLKKKNFSDKLRLALNMVELEACLQLPVTFLLHPANIFLTKDARPKIAYRGLPEMMIPKSIDASDFLRQLKCFIVTLFSDYDFMELYNGSLEVVTVPDFLKELRDAADIEQLRVKLEENYETKLAQESATLTTVVKRRYTLYKHASIWLTVGLFVLAVPLVYLIFMHNPFKETMLDADNAFIKVDYTRVIDKLEGVGVKNLPYTQKYELAYSYIQGLNFSDEQKKVILNNVTLKSDELYLTYWVQIGRSQNEDALDTAKRLDDTDLIIYALTQTIKQVREDDSLSGSDREKKINELTGEYKKYWEDRDSALTEATSGSSSETNGESSSKASSQTKD